MEKISKNPCIYYSQNLKNPILDSFWVTFWLKKLKTKFFVKNIICVNFKSLGRCNFMQKIRSSMQWLLIIPEKSYFGFLLVKTLENKVIPKKTFVLVLVLSLNVAITSCKKSKRFHALTFNNTWKTLFWIHFWPLLVQKPWNKKDFLKLEKLISVPFGPKAPEQDLSLMPT